MNSLAIDRAWEFFADIAIRSCLLILVAGVCLVLLRNAAAAYRHLVLTLLFGSLLLLPVLSSVSPPWSINWRIGAPRSERSEATTLSSQLAPTRTLPERRPIVPGTVTSVFPNALPSRIPAHREVNLSGLLRTTDPTEDTVQQRPAMPASTLHPENRADTSHAEAHVTRSSTMRVRLLKSVALLTWLIGCTIEFLRILGGVIGTARLRRKGLPIADEATRRTVAEVCVELGLRSNVVLLQTSAGCDMSVPITWGLLHPVLLLPATLIEWPQERLRAILLHEMAHIARRDWPIQVLAHISRAVYWFHPPIRWAAHQLYLEGERACDDRVLLAGVAPSVYAGTLLEVIRTMKPSAAFPKSALSIARSPIEGRLRAILTPRRRQGLSRPVLFLATIGATTCVLALASIHVGAASRKAPPILQTSGVVSGGAHTDQAHTNRVRPRGISQPSITHTRAKPSSNSATDARDEQIRSLRKRMDTLERLLSRNQIENHQLRQQLILLRSMTSTALASPTETHQGSQQQRREASAIEAPILTASQQARIDTIKMTLQDLQQQRSLLQQKLLQVQSLYRQGVSGPNPVTQTQAELTNNRVAIDSAQQQLTELEAGIHRSQRDQLRNLLQLQITKLKNYLLAQQEELKITQKRYQAGLATEADVTDAHQSVSRTRVEIDNLQLQLLESE